MLFMKLVQNVFSVILEEGMNIFGISGWNLALKILYLWNTWTFLGTFCENLKVLEIKNANSYCEMIEFGN